MCVCVCVCVCVHECKSAINLVSRWMEVYSDQYPACA